MLEMIPAALAIAGTPIPAIPAVLLLFTKRPRSSASAFLAGWALAVLVAVVVMTLVTEYIELGDEPPSWVAWSRVVLGALLMALALKKWRGRHDETTPGWLLALEQATPGSAFRLGLLLAGANPKNLAFAAVGGLAIGSADDLSGAAEGGALIVFVLIASLTAALPLVTYLVWGDRALAPLGSVRDWLTVHHAAALAVVVGTIGTLVLLEGVTSL